MSKEVGFSNMGLPSEHEMMVFRTMAKGAVQSRMYKGDESAVMMIMLAARELGIPPMAALNGGLHIIQGKVEISARMMNALIRRAGHSLIVKESTDERCTLVGVRSDIDNTIEATYTVQDAQKAGLVKAGGGWVKFPKDMCFARALSRLSRQLFSDVIGIGYVEGEILDKTNEEKEPEKKEDDSIPKIVNEGGSRNNLVELPSLNNDLEPIITDEMEKEFLDLLKISSEKWKENVGNYVMNKLGCNSLKDVSYKEYLKLLNGTKKHIEERIKEHENVGRGNEGVNPEVSGEV